MCGFAALFEPGRTFAPDLLRAIDADLYHRGPDSGGEESETGHALVFRRLSILDTRSDADQPMHDEAGRYSLVYNGEIYNFRRLRADLEAAGHRFRTSGDTEVLLRGFMEWGEGVLDRLEGMYAFLIIDRQSRTVTAARDPFGIKPLYMMRQGELTAFASEARPLRRLGQTAPDPVAMAELLLFRFAAGRLSNLTGIERIPGGTVVRTSLDGGEIRERRFCDILDTLGHPERMDMNEAARITEDAVRHSVHDHLASDVGYAVQLSGGIDSSLVTVLAARESEAPLHSFGLDLGDTPHDESEWRREAVEVAGPVHHEVPIDSHTFADAFPRAVAHMEGPSPHLGCVLLMLLCDEIRPHTKVVLTGEGADEMFGGYQRYGIWRNLQKYRSFARMVPDFAWPLLDRYRAIRIYADHDPAIYAAVFADYLNLTEIFPELVARPGAREAAAARFSDFRDRMYAVDQTAYLESLLLRQDKMAMAASVESRVPFTHLPLAREVNRFPHALRTPGGTTKPLLKRFAENFFSHEFVHRRKVGLTLPLAEWLTDPTGLGRMLELLTEADARLAGFGDRAGLRALVERFRGGETAVGRILVHLINIELWLRSLDDLSPAGAVPATANAASR